MPFLMFCDNKGCGKDQEPLLDLSDDQVYCTNCGNAIKQVTPFAKTQMRALGQIKRTKKAQSAFAIACEDCKTVSQPILQNEKLACPHCKKVYEKLDAPRVHAIKTWLLSNARSV